jgi:hypothetical protein
MMEQKDLPNEYLSIRTIWLRGIEECRKAISQVANLEASSERREFHVAGARTVCYTVDALNLSLVDFGEATIKTDVDAWMDEHYNPELRRIWLKKTKKKPRTVFNDLADEEDDEDDGKTLSVEGKWWANYKISKELYHQILQILNFYGMLFPEPYKGYSNVVIEELDQLEKGMKP